MSVPGHSAALLGRSRLDPGNSLSVRVGTIANRVPRHATRSVLIGPESLPTVSRYALLVSPNVPTREIRVAAIAIGLKGGLCLGAPRGGKGCRSGKHCNARRLCGHAPDSLPAASPTGELHQVDKRLR